MLIRCIGGLGGYERYFRIRLEQLLVVCMVTCKKESFSLSLSLSNILEARQACSFCGEYGKIIPEIMTNIFCKCYRVDSGANKIFQWLQRDIVT